MNKDELLAQLGARTGLSRRRAERAVHAVFDALAERLQRGERIEVRGFGNFVVRDSAAHHGHHPRTGATRTVPAQRCVLFRPSKALRAALARDAAAACSAIEAPRADDGDQAGHADGSREVDGQNANDDEAGPRR